MDWFFLKAAQGSDTRQTSKASLPAFGAAKRAGHEVPLPALRPFRAEVIGVKAWSAQSALLQAEPIGAEGALPEGTLPLLHPCSEVVFVLNL